MKPELGLLVFHAWTPSMAGSAPRLNLLDLSENNSVRQKLLTQCLSIFHSAVYCNMSYNNVL